MPSRGVSDVLGYVFVFAIIVATVGVIYTAGFASIQETREAERVNNLERAFDVLDENVETVAAGDAPARGTTIRVTDATLGFGDTVMMNVSVDGESYRAAITPLVAAVADTQIVYANGAIIRGTPGSAYLFDTPPLVIGERTVIPVLDTRPVRDQSVSGRVRVVTEATRRSVVRYETNATDTAVLTVTSPRARAWAGGLDGYENVSCSVSGNSARCTISDVEVVVLQVVSLAVELT